MAESNWRRVFQGYLDLDRSAQRRFLKKLREYEDGSYTEKKEIAENIRITLGPVTDVCPCCGK